MGSGTAVGVLDDSHGSVVLDAARTACAQAEISEADVPTLLFSTSPQDDYHRPTDAIEKIDPLTLHKITRALRFTAEQLAR